MTEPTFVGIDIGGTYTRLAIVDAVGRIQADRRCETPADDGLALMEWLGEAFSICREETDSHPAPNAIGVALPGVLDPSRSAVVRALNLPAIEGLPIRELLVERTGLMTVLDCDTVAGAWGEYCVRERRVRRMVYLTIGTGVGGAVLVEGQVLRHTHHSAGHLGHLICDSSTAAPRCGCGVRGCLEAKIGGPALNAAAVEAGFADGIADIEVAYQEGQAAAIHFVNEMARYLSIGLLSIAHVYPVDLLVVGGGVASALPSFIRQAGALAAEQESALVPDTMRIELAGLGDYSGVVGAALLAAEATNSQ